MTNHDDGIAKWYADKRAEAKQLRLELNKAIVEGTNIKEIERLRRKLEQALYVGD